MGGDRTAAAEAERYWSPASGRFTGGGERDPLYGLDRLPVAHAAEGLSAVHDGAELLLRLARQQAVVDDQQQPRHGGAREGREGSESNGRRDRQPVGEDDGKRWNSRL